MAIKIKNVRAGARTAKLPAPKVRKNQSNQHGALVAVPPKRGEISEKPEVPKSLASLIERHAPPGSNPDPNYLLGHPDGAIVLSNGALELFQVPDPGARFAALQYHQMSNLSALISRGASPMEVHLAVTLVRLLYEASDGNYSNPMWPKPKKIKNNEKRGRRQPTFDRSRAFGALMGLIKTRLELDALTVTNALDKNPKRIAENTTLACSRVAYNLDRALKPAKISVERWMPNYKKARRTTGSSNPPIFDAGQAVHKMTRRLESWYGGEAPDELRSGTDATSTLEWVSELLKAICRTPEDARVALLARNYNGLLELTADLMRYSTPTLK